MSVTSPAESSSSPEEQRPNQVYEKVVTTGYGAKVMVAGLDHGTMDAPFPHRELLEQHLSDFEQTGVTIAAMAPDSLSTMGEYRGELELESKDYSVWNWHEYLVHYGKNHLSTSMLAVDPFRGFNLDAVYVSGVNKSTIAKKKIQYFKDLQTARDSDPKLLDIAEQERIRHIIEMGGLGLGALIGGAMVLGVAKNFIDSYVKAGKKIAPISRRDFLAQVGALGVLSVGGIIFNSLMRDWKGSLSDAESAIVTEKLGDPPLPDFIVAMIETKPVRLFMNSSEVEPGELMGSSLEDRAMRNFSNKIGDIWRNAMIADAIDQVPTTLNPSFSGPWNKFGIAVPMGADHLVVPEEGSLSWFVTNPKARQSTIKEGMALLDIFTKDYPEFADHITNFINEVKSGGVGYQFKEDGTYNEWKIPYPSLNP